MGESCQRRTNSTVDRLISDARKMNICSLRQIAEYVVGANPIAFVWREWYPVGKAQDIGANGVAHRRDLKEAMRAVPPKDWTGVSPNFQAGCRSGTTPRVTIADSYARSISSPLGTKSSLPVSANGKPAVFKAVQSTSRKSSDRLAFSM
jgi:hypothetical protein